ncbi:hypothetical protein INR49_002255 [Caranx melampygus]|nr:hypothetical protein INR49_002255 [Caranx melampygus]
MKEDVHQMTPMMPTHQPPPPPLLLEGHLHLLECRIIPTLISVVMHLVEAGLYIGTAADLNDRQALEDAAITHILSVDSVDPAFLLPAECGFHRKWINVLDEATSDLLSHIENCILFIKEAMDGGQAAIVHCQAGRSRSATIVTAFLMKRHQLSFNEAYHRLKSVKQDVQINSGFEEQLHLYEAMNCEVDTSSPLYKQYRLTKLTEKFPGKTHT